MASLKDLSVHENDPFDTDDFPQLTAHPNSAGSFKDSWVLCGSKALELSIKTENSVSRMKIFLYYQDLRVEILIFLSTLTGKNNFVIVLCLWCNFSIFLWDGLMDLT